MRSRKSIAGATLIFLASAAITGCASLRPGGLLMTDVTYPVAVTSNTVGNRIGEACAQSFLFLVTVGDAGIEAARRNGALTEVFTVDQTVKNYGPFYAKTCTIVRGK